MGYFDNILGGREGRFADPADIKRAGFFKRGGIYLGLGRLTGRRLHYNGEGASIIFGRPEVGKTTKLVIPTLLTFKAGSVVVTDPKGTLTAQTDERRKALGNRVIYLNPWREELHDKVGVDYEDTGFNPLSLLKASDGVGAVKDNAAMISKMLSPCPAGRGASENFFNEASARVLADVMTFSTFSPNHDNTLTALYRLVHGTHDDWKALCRDMVALPSPDLSAAAKNILSHMASDRQWAGVDSSLKGAVEIYDPDKPLGKHVEKDGFDPDDLKREKITVYLVCPSSRRADNKRWFSLVMSLCAEAIARGGYTHPILLLIEEMGNLGYFPMTRFLAELREAGLRAVLTLQSVRQLNEIYGQEEARLIVDLCAVRQYLQIDDLETARMVSDTLGDYQHIEQDENGRVTVRERRPIMRPHEVMRLNEKEQLIMPSGRCPPILARLKPYYQVPEWERMTGANPLRPESVREQVNKRARGIWLQVSRGLLIGGALLALALLYLSYDVGAVGVALASVAVVAFFYRFPLPSRVWAYLSGRSNAVTVDGRPPWIVRLVSASVSIFICYLFVEMMFILSGHMHPLLDVWPRVMMFFHSLTGCYWLFWGCA